MLKFEPISSEATQRLIRDATSLEVYLDALALLYLVTRMVSGQGGPRFTVADADQRLSEIRDSLKSMVGADVSDTVEENRANLIAALARASNEEEVESFIEALVIAQRTIRRAAHMMDGENIPESDLATSQETFFRGDYRYLIKTLMYVGATKEEAQDSVSSALVDVVRAWDSVNDPLRWTAKAALGGYLKEKRRASVRVRDPLVQETEGTAEVSDDLQMSLWEDRHWVAQILESLPPNQRDTMRLISEGRSPREIADLLGRTPSAIRHNLAQARTRLKGQIQEERAVKQEPRSSASKQIQEESSTHIRGGEEAHEDHSKETDKEPVGGLIREYFDLVDETVTVA